MILAFAVLTGVLLGAVHLLRRRHRARRTAEALAVKSQDAVH